jgi:hypothetical protein
MVERLFTSVDQNVLFFKLFYAIRMQPTIQQILAPQFIALNNTLRGNLEQVLGEMGYRNTEVEAKLLFALLDGVCNHYVLYHGRFPIDEMRETIVRRYTGGLAS